MKKRTKILAAAVALATIGGGIYMTQESQWWDSLFEKRPSAKERQLAYLKKHEKEMAEFVIQRNPKIKSVQFDWDSLSIEDIGNGTPQGGGYILTIDGSVDSNKNTSFTIGFPLDRDDKQLPEINRISEMQPIRILKGNGEVYYE